MTFFYNCLDIIKRVELTSSSVYDTVILWHLICVFFTIYFKALRFYKCFDEEVLVIDQWKHSGRTSKPRVDCTLYVCVFVVLKLLPQFMLCTCIF